MSLEASALGITVVPRVTVDPKTEQRKQELKSDIVLPNGAVLGVLDHTTMEFALSKEFQPKAKEKK